MFRFWFCKRNRAAFFPMQFHIWNVSGGFPSITSARLEDFMNTLGIFYTDCTTRKRQLTDNISTDLTTDAHHACLVVQWIMGSASFQQLAAKCENVFFQHLYTTWSDRGWHDQQEGTWKEKKNKSSSFIKITNSFEDRFCHVIISIFSIIIKKVLFFFAARDFKKMSKWHWLRFETFALFQPSSSGFSLPKYSHCFFL